MTRVQERSEEHTSELQSRVDISYAVFCLKKKKHTAAQDTAPARRTLCRGLRVPRHARRAGPLHHASGLHHKRVGKDDPVFFFFLKMGRPAESPLFPHPPLSG